MKNKPQQLINLLKEKKLTLALAESMTCGMAAHKLSLCIGTSEVLICSIVCYTPQSKMMLLDISKRMIRENTCESSQVTRQLALNLKKRTKADVCAAITGLSSPGGSETKQKPVGTVFLSVCYKHRASGRKFLFRGTPSLIHRKACQELYKMIIDKVIK